MPRQKTAPATNQSGKSDLFKMKDIKEEVLIDRVIKQAGVASDTETTGFIRAVLPRFAESSPRQAFGSMTKMVKEFGRGSAPTAGGGSSNQSNGGDREQSGQAVERRRPGRPPGSKNKTAKAGAASASNDKAQAFGEKRRPGRPLGSKNKSTARKSDRPQ